MFREIDATQMFVVCQHQITDDVLTCICTRDRCRIVLVDGRITSFMGFDWIPSERLSISGTTRCSSAWARNSLLFAAAAEFMVRIEERADKNYSTQVFASADFGATRMDETGVVEVQCTE